MFNCSEFEELEAVPTMAVMDGPLEPPSSTASNAADVPEDPAFVNFFSVCSLLNSMSHGASGIMRNSLSVVLNLKITPDIIS